jgi:hypothetical protein
MMGAGVPSTAFPAARLQITVHERMKAAPSAPVDHDLTTSVLK